MPRLARMRPLAVLAGAAAAAAITGCAGLRDANRDFLGVLTPYRVEVVQGNVVTKEQMARVKPGMTREQVRAVLGSPLLADAFHANRWDYIFTIRRQGTEPQRRSIVLQFDGDRLASVDAPELPSEREFVAAISTTRASGRTPALELTEEQRKALPVPPKPDPAPAEPSGPTREYPPLEPAAR
jgi:outer membrane protein assembly factor BamE